MRMSSATMRTHWPADRRLEPASRASPNCGDVGLVQRCWLRPDRIRIDPSVVRGLEYYTGPVFEIELTFPVHEREGPGRSCSARSAAVAATMASSRASAREPVPATGFSIGVSRLANALKLTGNLGADRASRPGRRPRHG